MEFKKEVEIYLEDEKGKYARAVIAEESGNVFNVVHTYVREDRRGEGLAAKLMDESVSYIRSRGGLIKGDCSYASHYLEKRGIEHTASSAGPSCSLKHMRED